MQLRLAKSELKRLGERVEEDYAADIADHQRRIDRFRRYMRKWRNLVTPPRRGEEEKPNFSVPLVQWQVLGQVADDIGKLLGADAEIIAKPTGPSDQRLVRKIGRFMTWRAFQSMRLVNPFCTFAFRKTLFGRTHAYSPWIVDAFPVKQADEYGLDRITEEVFYEGPGFFPLRPDDLITPAEDADTIHDFSHVIRRYRTTPDRMLRGEAAGLYQGVSERFEELVEFAKSGNQRENLGEEIRLEEDEAEGVEYQGAQSAKGTITVHEWYGRWRRLKGRQDAREDNLDRRYRWESELVVRRIPDLDWVVGVQDLLDIYPRKRRRRPFVEASLIKDGSYWSPSFGELLESVEDEATVNHRLFTQAGQLSVGPIIFFKPSSGFDPDAFRVEPGMCVPSEDPAGIRPITFTGNLEYAVVKEQALMAYAERVTGRSDMTLGRQPDRPNAPRTARGTIALLEQGNIRANLDTTVFREDMGEVVNHFWELEQQFPGGARRFFRVTEEDAGKLFNVSGGGAFLEPDELGGRYDFDLKFATSVYSREAEKERHLALYQADLSNPLIAQNPRALWRTTQGIHKALGDDNLADVLPEPPDLPQPVAPRDEWTRALQGEEILLHPEDHDDLHLRDHVKRVQEEMEQGERADRPAVEAMVQHIGEHKQQKAQKMLMQALTSQLVSTFADSAKNGQGLLGGQGPAQLQQLQQALAQMMGPGQGAQPGGQPGLPPEGMDALAG